MVCRSVRLQSRKMYRSKRSQESHRKGRRSGFRPENGWAGPPMPPIFAGRGRSLRLRRRLTIRACRRILLTDTSRWGFQQRLSRRVAPEEFPKDLSSERSFEIEGWSKSTRDLLPVSQPFTWNVGSLERLGTEALGTEAWASEPNLRGLVRSFRPSQPD